MVAGVSYKIWEETDFGFYGDETLVLVGRGILGRSRKRVAFLEPLLYDRKNCSAIRMKRRMILKRNKKVVLNVLLTLAVLIWIFVANPNLNPVYADGAFHWCHPFLLRGFEFPCGFWRRDGGTECCWDTDCAR